MGREEREAARRERRNARDPGPWNVDWTMWPTSNSPALVRT